MITDILKHAFRNEYAAWLTDGFDTCCHIEAITKGIDTIVADITDMDTNADRHFRIFLVLDLHFYSTFDRIDATVKDAEGTVTEKLEYLATIFFMQGKKDTSVSGTKEQSMIFIDMHEVCVPYDIRKNDCCELA